MRMITTTSKASAAASLHRIRFVLGLDATLARSGKRWVITYHAEA